MSNPVFNESRWDQIAAAERPATRSDVMTVNGTIFKTSVLLVILLATVGWMWSRFWNNGSPDVAAMQIWLFGGAIGGLVMCFVAMFAPRATVVVAPLYAVAEGLFIGGLTMLIQVMYPKAGNLPMLAACLTTACMLAMLLLYQLRIIQATPGFVRGVMIATAGLAIGLGLLALLNMFGIGGGMRSALGGGGVIGIGFSALCIGIAAFNLVVDFAFIEQGAQQGQPKHMEWVGAFGLLVTLVWLYIEILSLLAKLQRRD